MKEDLAHSLHSHFYNMSKSDSEVMHEGLLENCLKCSEGRQGNKEEEKGMKQDSTLSLHPLFSLVFSVTAPGESQI